MKDNELINKADLKQFKKELFSFIEDKFNELNNNKTNTPANKWVKSKDVKSILNISSGTLQTLRNTDVIPFKRIMGTLYYNIDDINHLFESKFNEIQNCTKPLK